MDTISPVMICSDRIIPRRNPMFHNREIDLGDGRSTSDELTIFISGWVFISCFFIRRRSLRFGGDCDRGRLVRLV